jgi:hypothetical protein
MTAGSEILWFVYVPVVSAATGVVTGADGTVWLGGATVLIFVPLLSGSYINRNSLYYFLVKF